MQVVLPYIKTEKKDAIFSPEKIELILHECVLLSAAQPCYLEIRGDMIQWYLFFRERQLYAAGKIENGQFAGATIKDFLLGCAILNSATFSCYTVNNKILHSILILFQKKPSIKIATSLVDLDKLLDKIEEEGKSCIISASQDDFLAILRYEKGVVTALCSEHSFPYPKEETFRDDFLVKIYTLSAEKQLQIYLYEDLLVHFASDAKLVEASFAGNFADLFLSKPPTVVLYLKGKELSRFSLDKPVTNIGRTRENDIAIDNLAISRLHATIEENKGTYFIKDCDSLNGTLVNGHKIGRARLEDGDEIIIGKHKLVYRAPGERVRTETALHEDFEQTFIISPGQMARPPDESASPPSLPSSKPFDGGTEHIPRLLEKTSEGERVIELTKPSLVLGSDDGADISIGGLFVAGRHAEISKVGDHYVIKHLKGLRKVRVCGKPVVETVLSSNDDIKIANKEFIFLE